MDDPVNLSWYERIPAERVRCIVQNIRRVAKRRYDSQPLWTLVRDAFGVGSTVANEICRRVDLDPNQKVKATTTRGEKT